MVAKYRKKPVVIEAVQFNGSNRSMNLFVAWMTNNGVWPFATLGIEDKDNRLHIPTLEGTMEASPGDYIIRGVHGEFYPCKPEIFEATYEVVDGQEG